MYCRNCGNNIPDGSKFCSECGTKISAEENIAAAAPAVSVPDMPEVKAEEAKPAADDAPLFEPFDFKAFGFDFSELGLGTGIKTEEGATKPTPPTETFNWNTGEYPDQNTATKTEDINFNWSLSPEDPVPAAPVAPQPEKPAAPQPAEPKAEPVKEPVQESGLFGSLDSKADETRKQSEEIDKFFTFHQKNEEFQRILDREYEKVKSGNIIAEEMNAAEAGAEERFTERKPEDPMEELFASEGVIRTYEPKPVETDVLDRIEAADEEKRVREEAARLIEQEREKARLEAAAAKAAVTAEIPAAPAAEPVVEEPAVPTAETPAEEPAAEAPAADDFDLFAQLEALDDEKEAEEPAVPAAEEPAAAPAVEIPAAPAAAPAETPAAETPVIETPAEEPVPAAPAVPAAETPVIEVPVVETPAEESAVPAAELTEEQLPEKTKTVDKAAILAGMAIANEMVERDRAIAAEQAAEAAAAVPTVHIDETNVELPDFLGHEDVVQAQEEPEEVVNEEVEFEIFEQLENAEASPEEEIVLNDSQTLVDLFADAETVEDHEKGWTEHTLILSEDSVAEILNASGEEEVTENTVLFSSETLGAILAEAEKESPEGSEVVVSVESLTDVPAVPTDAEEEEEEEAEHSGKGRTVLKVLLVILIVLLALEIAGVVIKLAAPTSGAANFIDNQLTKVFQLISGDDDKELNVFAEAEEIRTEAIVDKTELIAAEKSKNKDGNIASIVYNQDLAFDSGKKYENTDLNLTQELADVAWYKNADNKQVYYDQAIVGAMIAYESQRVNLVNGSDTTVLNLMVNGTELYNEVSASAGKGGMTFEVLQLGEIRQSGNNFYIWVAEIVNGETETYIYEMQPEGETMKIKACYEA